MRPDPIGLHRGGHRQIAGEAQGVAPQGLGETMQYDIHQGLGPVATETGLQGQSQTGTFSGERDLLQDDILKAAGGQGLNNVYQRPAMFSAARTDADLHCVPGHGSSFAVRDG